MNDEHQRRGPAVRGGPRDAPQPGSGPESSSAKPSRSRFFHSDTFQERGDGLVFLPAPPMNQSVRLRRCTCSSVDPGSGGQGASAAPPPSAFCFLARRSYPIITDTASADPAPISWKIALNPHQVQQQIRPFRSVLFIFPHLFPPPSPLPL